MIPPTDTTQRSLVTALAEALGRTVTVKKPSPKGRACVAQIRERGVAKPFTIRVSVTDRACAEDDAWGVAGAYLLAIARGACPAVTRAWLSQRQARDRSRRKARDAADARADVARADVAYLAALAAAAPDERRLFDAVRALTDATRDAPALDADAVDTMPPTDGATGTERRLALLTAACRSLAASGPVGTGLRVPLSQVTPNVMRAVMAKRGWRRHDVTSPSNDGVSIERWVAQDGDTFIKLREMSNTDVRLWCDDVARAHPGTSEQEVLAEAFAEANVPTE